MQSVVSLLPCLPACPSSGTRVIVEETADEFVIVILYKTSKFKKYEEELRS